MRKIYFRFRILLMTFALSLASVHFVQNIQLFDCQTKETIEISELKNSLFVTVAPELPRFRELSSYCAIVGGCTNVYISNDGFFLLEESPAECKKPNIKDKKIVLSDNERIISKIKNERGQRFKIYQFRNQRCIKAHNIEIGLELEKFLKNNP